MVSTDAGKGFVTLLLGGSSTNKPAYMAIGSGSGISDTSKTGLYNPIDIKPFLQTDCGTAKTVTWTTDFDAVAMSGDKFCEFAPCTGSPPSNNLWGYENIGIALTFDGTKELRIEYNYEVF